MNSILKHFALLAATIAIYLAFCSSYSLAFTTTYTYDDAGRLISEDYGNGTIVTYTYDENGNLISCALAGATNQFPIIDSFSATPQNVNAGDAVTFTCTAHDPDGSITSYQWDLDGDGNVDQTTSDGSVTYTYTDTGTYQAKVTVVDNSGAETTSGPVTITVGLTIPGDANGDGNINVQDVVCIINVILDTGTAPGILDCNGDGNVNVLDVICVINKILGG